MPSKPTIVETLNETLAQEIAAGTLGPGTWLDEQRLADRFGVSRTPVREALGQLVASGLADRRPHRGVVVAAVTVERLNHMFEVMTELEGTCARLAALRMTPQERETLAALHKASAAAATGDDIAAYTVFNRRFHQAIYDGGHNPFLIEMTQDVRRRLAPFRNAQFRVDGRPAASFQEHAAVLEGILAGRGEAAHAAMVAHIREVRDAYRDLSRGGERPAEMPPGLALPEL